MYRIQIRGHEIVCDSVEELEKVMDHFSEKEPTKPPERLEANHMSPIERYIKFLDVLVNVGKSGIAASELAKAIGVKGGKGLSPVANNLRDRLTQYNVTISDLVETREVEGVRFWRAGPRASEMLNILRMMGSVGMIRTK